MRAPSAFPIALDGTKAPSQLAPPVGLLLLVPRLITFSVPRLVPGVELGVWGLEPNGLIPRQRQSGSLLFTLSNLGFGGKLPSGSPFLAFCPTRREQKGFARQGCSRFGLGGSSSSQSALAYLIAHENEGSASPPWLPCVLSPSIRRSKRRRRRRGILFSSTTPLIANFSSQ